MAGISSAWLYPLCALKRARWHLFKLDIYTFFQALTVTVKVWSPSNIVKANHGLINCGHVKVYCLKLKYIQ